MTGSNTIAAIATGLTNSGIGIIRISGESAFEVADSIFIPQKKGMRLKDQKTYTAHYGHIWDGDQVIDEVVVLLMRGPKSYTAEDTAEIQCHGGVMVMKRILELAVQNGARLAEPGEFTKRAFLNGRIDLSQAEAVMDVIQAKNEYALKSSVSQLRGSVSEKVRELRESLLYEVAYIESALDDPEHISLDGYPETLKKKAAEIRTEIEKLIRSFENGRVISEGIRTVILGKPNAGKSSLMNVLLGEERAIVTEIAGTTRDTLEESVRIHGINLHVIDTAGIRETADRVEQIGVERALKAAKDADLILYVVDGSCPLDENDDQIIEEIRGKKALVLLNKSDLPQVFTADELKQLSGHEVLSISAREEKGIDLLEQKIQELFFSGKIDWNDELLITNVRHKAALEEAAVSLSLVEQSIKDGLPEDFFSIDLMNAYEQLGMILGEALGEDLIQEIFSRFCMGK